jgi:hypothetical protein
VQPGGTACGGLQVIGTMLGPYRVLAKLGEGGMGDVHCARDGRLNRDVALKVLPPAVANAPDALARFAREAQAIAALSHPDILAARSEVPARPVAALQAPVLRAWHRPLCPLLPRRDHDRLRCGVGRTAAQDVRDARDTAESAPLNLPPSDVLSVSASGQLALSLGRTFETWVSAKRCQSLGCS